MQNRYALIAAFIGHNKANFVTHPINGDLQYFAISLLTLTVKPDYNHWPMNLVALLNALVTESKKQTQPTSF